MNVSLTPELEELVLNKVKSGRYLSASEVVREALRLLDDHDRLREMKLEEVRKKIQVGFDQLDRGEGIPLEEAFDRLARIHEESRKRMGR
jgi:antitoxin ParD1/3/4